MAAPPVPIFGVLGYGRVDAFAGVATTRTLIQAPFALSPFYSPTIITRLFRSMIRDKAAFCASVRRLLAEHRFKRLIPGHGQIISSGAMEILQNEIDRL